MTFTQEQIRDRAQANADAQALRDLTDDAQRDAQAKALEQAEKDRAFNAAEYAAREAEKLNVPLFAERDKLDAEIGERLAKRAAIQAQIVERRQAALGPAYQAGADAGLKFQAGDDLRILNGRPLEQADITGDDNAAKWARFVVKLIGGSYIFIGDDGRGYVQVGTKLGHFSL